MKAGTLDHVALWVTDRDTLAGFLTDNLGMHVIDRSDEFTLVGADARRGKLTLFRAEGERDPGQLERVVLRVSDLDRALAQLPGDLAVQRVDGGVAQFEGPEGLGLGLVEGAGAVDYDIDHVVLRVGEPERAFGELAQLGFTPDNGRLMAGDGHLELRAGEPGASEQPLLNHVALRVGTAEEYIEEARLRGMETDVVDGPNTYAVFVWGPDRIKLEYVEHKPGFSLV